MVRAASGSEVGPRQPFALARDADRIQLDEELPEVCGFARARGAGPPQQRGSFATLGDGPRRSQRPRGERRSRFLALLLLLLALFGGRQEVTREDFGQGDQEIDGVSANDKEASNPFL